VLSLLETGDLKLAGKVLTDGKGSNLYLLPELDPKAYMPDGPLTWLGTVERAFNEIWELENRQAAANNRRPRPISTGQVRAQLAADLTPHPNLGNTKLVPNALVQLSKSKTPSVRQIKRRGEKRALWAPLSVPDEALDFGDIYASDTERIGTAVERAVRRLGRPVSLRDVAEEVKMDPYLRPAGLSSLFEILSDASKEKIGVKKGERYERVIRRVYRAGRIGGDAYYFNSMEGLPEAAAYVRFAEADSRWHEAEAEEEIAAIGACTVLSIAVGRALLVQAEVHHVLHILESLLKGANASEAVRLQANQLREKALTVNSLVADWTASAEGAGRRLPSKVDTHVPGWTASELLPIISPFYPPAQAITEPAALVRLLWDDIRRVQNPGFKTRFSNNPQVAAEYLFDRADALLFMGRKWGGKECSFQAMVVSHQLGRLRDPRFVLPATKSNEEETRLNSAACLGFLWSDEGNRRLRELAVNDPSPGVRETALWAYGFACGKGAIELLHERKTEDPSNRVRMFIEKALKTHGEPWWIM
jgi:hypothetical protein